MRISVQHQCHVIGFYECGDETKELAFDGPGMRLQLWANSEEKRLLGIIQRHSILLGESPVARRE